MRMRRRIIMVIMRTNIFTRKVNVYVDHNVVDNDGHLFEFTWLWTELPVTINSFRKLYIDCSLPRLIRTGPACLWIFKWIFGDGEGVLCIRVGVISIRDGGIVNLWIELPVTINGFRQGRTLIVASRLNRKSRNLQIPSFLHHSSTVSIVPDYVAGIW